VLPSPNAEVKALTSEGSNCCVTTRYLNWTTTPHNMATEVAELHARVAEDRPTARLLGGSQRAVEFELATVRLTPENRNRWIDLSNLCQSLGRTSDAEGGLEKTQATEFCSQRAPVKCNQETRHMTGLLIARVAGLLPANQLVPARL